MKTLFFVILCLCLETVIIHSYHLRKQDSADPQASADATIEEASLDKLRKDIRTNYAVIKSLTQKYEEDEKKIVADNESKLEAQLKENEEDNKKLNQAHIEELETKNKELAEIIKEANESNKKLLVTLSEIRDKEREQMINDLYELEKSEEEQYKKQLETDEVEIKAQFKKEEEDKKVNSKDIIDSLKAEEASKIRDLNVEKNKRLSDAAADGDKILAEIRDNLQLSQEDLKSIIREAYDNNK